MELSQYSRLPNTFWTFVSTKSANYFFKLVKKDLKQLILVEKKPSGENYILVSCLNLLPRPHQFHVFWPRYTFCFYSPSLSFFIIRSRNRESVRAIHACCPFVGRDDGEIMEPLKCELQQKHLHMLCCNITIQIYILVKTNAVSQARRTDFHQT